MEWNGFKYALLQTQITKGFNDVYNTRNIRCFMMPGQRKNDKIQRMNSKRCEENKRRKYLC